MAVPSVEELYKAYDAITNAAGDQTKIGEAFNIILSGCSGGASEKRLSSQFIARFFNSQPKEVQEKAFYRMIDLCEDEEVVIRRQAVMDLGTLARTNTAFQSRISDVLVQMLTADDTQEHNLVEQALVRLLSQDPPGTLNSIFQQILMSATAETEESDENREVLREAAIKFLAAQLRRLPDEALKPELEELIVGQVKKVLEDVSEEEFLQLITILASLKSMSSLVGRQNLVNLISEQVVGPDGNAGFDPSDMSSVARVTECAKQAVQYMSKNVHAKSFVEFFLDKVVPRLEEIPREEAAAAENGDGEPAAKENPRLNLLRAFAQMCPHHGPHFQATEAQLAPLLSALCNEMPLPPSAPEVEKKEEEVETVTETVTVTETETVTVTETETEAEADAGDLRFSEVECLLFSLHQLARLKAEFLTEDEQRLHDFRQRLQYFSRRSNTYLRSLQAALQSKTKAELNAGDNKLRVVALKLTNNLHLLIRDLFKKPPAFKAAVGLSWISPNAGPVGGKRPLAYEEDVAPAGGKRRGGQEPYRPPRGKFSERAGAPPAMRGRGRRF